MERKIIGRTLHHHKNMRFPTLSTSWSSLLVDYGDLIKYQGFLQ